MEKQIHWELCKRLYFVKAKELYILKPKAIQKNGMRKILWEFKIHTDYEISTSETNLALIEKNEITFF